MLAVRRPPFSAQTSFILSEKSAPTTDAERPVASSPPAFRSYTDLFFELGAEFVGTLILCAFGTGGNCQYSVGAPTFDTYATVPIGWAVGIALGAGFAAPRSGGHINPAVTAMLALVGKVPWWKFPLYGLAQLAGGFAGAAISYAVYFNDINTLEGGSHRTISKTAGLFGTYPELTQPAFSCWLAEFFPACVLLGVVLYLVCLRQKLPFGFIPFVLFLTLLGIGCTFGSTTSFSINPARDLGPRLLTYAAEYGSGVWTYKNEYWIWGGQMGAFSASVAVAGVYWIHRAVERWVIHEKYDAGEDLPVPPVEERESA